MGREEEQRVPFRQNSVIPEVLELVRTWNIPGIEQSPGHLE